MKTAGYERLFSVLRSVGPPSKELLHALLAMAAEEEFSEASRLMVISRAQQTHLLNVVAELLTLLLCVLEVPGLNIGPDTGYPD